MYQRSRTTWVKHLDFFFLDLLCLNIAFLLAYAIRFPGQGSAFANENAVSIVIVLSLVEIVASFLLGNLSNILRRGYLVELVRVATLAFATLALISLYLFSVHRAEVYSRLLVYYTIALFAFLDYPVRLIWKKLVLKLRLQGIFANAARSVLIVSDSRNAADIIRDIREDQLDRFDIAGLALVDESCVSEISGIPVVCSISGAADYICRKWVDEVFVFLPDQTSQPKAFLDACMEMGVTVHSVLNLSNVDKNKQFIERIGNHSVLTTAYNYIVPHQAVLKRLIDLAGGIVGSLFAILIIFFIGPVIYIKSPGPVIFKQTRIGRNGKPFTVYKLRSMYLDAEERKKDYMAQNRVSDGMMFKLDFDPRIIGNRVLPDGTKKTGIGEFIRKTSLDEFPQFFNVLKGDMSLVGTRPPTMDEWEKYEYHHRARLAMRPGITGMWQVSGRSNITDFEEIVKLDTEYICNYSLGLDIRILFKTVAVILKHEGAM